jgi:hypothetical protein
MCEGRTGGKKDKESYTMEGIKVKGHRGGKKRLYKS